MKYIITIGRYASTPYKDKIYEVNNNSYQLLFTNRSFVFILLHYNSLVNEYIVCSSLYCSVNTRQYILEIWFRISTTRKVNLREPLLSYAISHILVFYYRSYLNTCVLWCNFVYSLAKIDWRHQIRKNSELYIKIMNFVTSYFYFRFP